MWVSLSDCHFKPPLKFNCAQILYVKRTTDYKRCWKVILSVILFTFNFSKNVAYIIHTHLTCRMRTEYRVRNPNNNNYR